MTQAQRQQLERELAELEGPRREEMVQAIKVARSFGDLSENFEYHAAKNEQGLLERRITIDAPSAGVTAALAGGAALTIAAAAFALRRRREPEPAT